MYQPGEGVNYIFASNAGHEEDPQWFRNLKANPDTTIEIGGDTIAVTASEVTGAERDRIYARRRSVMPGFADYEKRTTRVIPVVALTRPEAPAFLAGGVGGCFIRRDQCAAVGVDDLRAEREQ